MKRTLQLFTLALLALSITACQAPSTPEELGLSSPQQVQKEQLGGDFDETPEPSEDTETMDESSKKTLMKAPGTAQESATEVLPEQRTASNDGFIKYNGRFFDIEYPESFEVKDEETFRDPDAEYHPGTDGMTVQSPDGEVQFYVYSPLCTGAAEWRELREGEREGDLTVEEAENHLITRGAITGPGYSRFFEERKGKYDMPCILVFGLQYSSAEAYEPYKEQYQHFKNSLIQYWWD